VIMVWSVIVGIVCEGGRTFPSAPYTKRTRKRPRRRAPAPGADTGGRAPLQGHRNPRTDPSPPNGEEARLQRNALTFVLSIDPTRLTQGELTRVVAANPEDAVQREAIVNAVAELVDAGLFCRDGNYVQLTRAALRFDFLTRALTALYSFLRMPSYLKKRAYEGRSDSRLSPLLQPSRHRPQDRTLRVPQRPHGNPADTDTKQRRAQIAHPRTGSCPEARPPACPGPP
jgi:hypothetical protein